MKVCAECKYKNPANAEYCNRCRQPLPFDLKEGKKYKPTVIVVGVMIILFIAFFVIKMLSETGFFLQK